MRHLIRLVALSTLALAFGTGVALCLPPALPAYAASPVATPEPATAAVAPTSDVAAETTGADTADTAKKKKTKKEKKVKAPLTGRLNLNTATAAELDRLPGIGPSKAERIIEARKQGPFKRVAGLLRVKGIGRKTVKKLSAFVKVEGESDLNGG